jgi:hypothetical protein
MTRKRWWLAIGVVVVAAAAAVALSLALTGGGSGAPKQLSHDDYEQLWSNTEIGDSEQAVLAQWPKVPDQHYVDNLKDDCYEWADVPVHRLNNLPAALYNLCFKDGVLRMKVLG